MDDVVVGRSAPECGGQVVLADVDEVERVPEAVGVDGSGPAAVGDEVERALLEVEELLDLDVEREGDVAGQRGGAGDGEVGAAGEVGAHSLQVRAQVAHVQALTCFAFHRLKLTILVQ